MDSLKSLVQEYLRDTILEVYVVSQFVISRIRRDRSRSLMNVPYSILNFLR